MGVSADITILFSKLDFHVAGLQDYTINSSPRNTIDLEFQINRHKFLRGEKATRGSKSTGLITLKTNSTQHPSCIT